MSFNVSLSENGDFLVITVNEDMTVNLAIEIGKELSKNVKKHQSAKFLFDLRNSRNVESAVSNYSFAYKEADEKILFKEANAALLTGKNDNSHDFLQMVMCNAGYNVKIFKDEMQAIAWLREEI